MYLTEYEELIVLIKEGENLIRRTRALQSAGIKAAIASKALQSSQYKQITSLASKHPP